jgi:DNA-3-methyladenine glycosylase
LAERLPRDWFARDSLEVAPELLNKVLATGDGRSGRIVEVEAYRGEGDPASHAFRGETPRVRTMFGPAGHLYVYFTYGMHWCANVVCGDPGEGTAVLVRALQPLTGLEQMRSARGSSARRDRDLCDGPAKLAQALGIGRVQDGADLVAGDDVFVLDDATVPPPDPLQTARVGISTAQEHAWRWLVPDSTYVSRGRPSSAG